MNELYQALYLSIGYWLFLILGIIFGFWLGRLKGKWVWK
jgi:hypothetical protein